MPDEEVLKVFPDGRVLVLRDAIGLPPPPPPPVVRQPQVHLLIAGAEIEDSSCARLVKQPVRTRTAPLISGADGNRNFQSAVIRDPVTGIFRMWHGVWDGVDPVTQYSIVRNVMRTSPDGIAWSAPTVIPSLGVGAIANVIDSGVAGPQRYRLVTRSNAVALPYNRWPGHLWFSADGLDWTQSPANPVTEPCGEIYVLHPDGSIMMRYNRAPWTDTNGVHQNVAHDPSFYRVLYQASLGPDGVHYGPATPAYLPVGDDAPELQFYSASNAIFRGDTRLCVVNILHDNLNAPGVAAPAYGTGYSVLGWKFKDLAWDRHHGTDPHYFDPNPTVGSWDHAISWITSLVEVGDKVYIYYGGYASGHKVYTDRGIGMEIIDRDRFVGRQSAIGGFLRTRPMLIERNLLSLNSKGTVTVAVLNAAGAPLPGYAHADHPATVGDSINGLPLDLTSLQGQTLRLEFKVWGELYAFTLRD